MPTQTSSSTRFGRHFNGFDVERSTYERLKSELFARAEGKFVAIVGDEMVGPHETAQEAERAGYARFGAGPLYIKQLLREGPTAGPVHLPSSAYADIASLALSAEALAPAVPPPGERPFLGYDRERAAYARLKPELLRRALGKYVVLVGDDLEGPVDTYEAALQAGWHRFGLGPLYVKQVREEDQATETAGELSCQS
jgi:hypothetical protein